MPAELQVKDSDERVAVGKIVGVGRNYAAHAREMGAAPAGEPVLFLKPASSVIGDGEVIIIPQGAGAVHHEVELGVVIGARCRRVAAEDALAQVFGYAVLIDVTARDLQAAAREKGLPWTLAKGLDTFCPISAVMPAARAPDPANLTLRLTVNDVLRQESRTADMLWSVPALIEFISARITLERGDVIATGTPAGVGPLVPGDLVEAVIEGVGALRCPVAQGEPPRAPSRPW